MSRPTRLQITINDLSKKKRVLGSGTFSYVNIRFRVTCGAAEGVLNNTSSSSTAAYGATLGLAH